MPAVCAGRYTGMSLRTLGVGLFLVMHEMSVVWLRIAAALYSVGLLHALLTILRKKASILKVAMRVFYVAVILHLVSIVEEAVHIGHFPANDFYESTSLCGFLIAVLFLSIHWRYELQGLTIFVFPLVFILTLVGALGSPVPSWSNPQLRDAWLVLHVFLVLIGYAALVLTAIASIMYLIRERQLKKKQRRNTLENLPALGTLDDLISKAMAVGFVFITLAVIAGSTWAFIESGTRWIKDARIVISLLTWGLYLAIVALRVSAGWRGRKAAMLVLALVGCSALTWAAHTGLRNLLSR
jgi:ABC-type uncharacterized transport system permease subunit